MREKLGPWLPAVFCAALAVITTIGNLWSYAATGNNGSVTMVFILHMPMCFFFVGVYLAKLRNDNRKLKERLDELTASLETA